MLFHENHLSGVSLQNRNPRNSVVIDGNGRRSAEVAARVGPRSDETNPRLYVWLRHGLKDSERHCDCQVIVAARSLDTLTSSGTNNQFESLQLRYQLRVVGKFQLAGN